MNFVSAKLTDDIYIGPICATKRTEKKQRSLTLSMDTTIIPKLPVQKVKDNHADEIMRHSETMTRSKFATPNNVCFPLFRMWVHIAQGRLRNNDRYVVVRDILEDSGNLSVSTVSKVQLCG